MPTTSLTSRPRLAALSAGFAGAAMLAAAAVPALAPAAQAGPRPAASAPSPAHLAGYVRAVRAMAADGRLTAPSSGSAVAPRSAASSVAPAAVTPVPEGAFIRMPDRKIYRIAGGAPVYVSTWTPFGGPKPLYNASATQISRLRLWPADGTLVTTLQNKAVWRFVGGAPMWVSSWPHVGGVRPTIGIDQAAVDHAGDFSAPQWIHVTPDPSVGELLDPRTGSPLATDKQIFVTGGVSHRVYLLVGGSPQYVPAWSLYGGVKPTTVIDDVTIDQSDEFSTVVPTKLRHLTAVPFDSWKIKVIGSNQLYTTAGGAPIATTTTAIFADNGIPQNTAALISQWDVDNSRPAGANKHLHYLPADGTTLTADAARTTIWAVTTGFADVVASPTAGQTATAVRVDGAAIANAGQPAPWDHLLSRP